MVARRVRPDELWMDQAGCKDMDRELFFPHIPYQGSMPVSTRKHVANMVSICRNHCPVRIECLEYARYFKVSEGIWGGVLFNRRGRPSKQTTEQVG